MEVPGVATIREGSILDSYFASAKREDVDSFWANFPENSEEQD